MQNSYENAIIKRIKILRNQLTGPRGKSKFARELGISPSTYSYYEDNRIPPIEILLKISELTGADLHWLLTGEEKTTADSSTAGQYTLGSTAAKGQAAAVLQRLNTLLAKNPDLAEPIWAFVELLAEKKGLEAKSALPADSAQPPAVDIAAEQTPSTPPSRPGWIPVLGRTAAGMVALWDQTLVPGSQQAVTELDELVKKHIGKSIIDSVKAEISLDLHAQSLVENLKDSQANLIQVSPQVDEQIAEFVQCEQIYRLFPDSFALRVDGDSMSPRINDGDIVIVSPSAPAVQGQVAIAKVANQIGVTCKLIRTTENQVHLIPINERYETKIVSCDDLLWALAVLCHISV